MVIAVRAKYPDIFWGLLVNVAFGGEMKTNNASDFTEVKRRAVSPVAFACLGVLGLVAAVWPRAASAMTLEEAVKLAVDSHPQILAAKAGQAIAEQEIFEARARYFPTIDTRVGLGVDHVNNQTTALRATRGVNGGQHVTGFHEDASVTVNQMLFDGLETPNLVEAAKARFDTRGYQVTDAEEAIALRAIEAFFEVQRSREVLALAEENVETHGEVLEDVTLRAETGGGNQADVVQARSRLALARTRVVEQHGELKNAEADFLEAVGTLPDELVVGDPPVAALPDNIYDFIVQSYASNPAMLAANSAIIAREEDAEAAEGVFVPRFDLEFNASAQRNADGIRRTNASATALVVMRFNLYSGGRDSARLRGAQELVSQTILQERETRRLVEEQARLDWSRLETSQGRLPNLEERVINAAQVVSAYRQQFELGQRTLLDVLDTENELFQSRSDLVEGEYDVHFAHWAILQTMGDALNVLGIVTESPAYVDTLTEPPALLLLAPLE